MLECEICGEAITKKNPETKRCPKCEKMRCQSCDMGSGTVCVDCEGEEADDV